MPNKIESIDVDLLAARVSEGLSPLVGPDTLMIGVHSGGAWLAARLHQSLGLASLLGTLDISFYRDDFTRIGLQPQVKGSDLPENIDDRDVVLVDDVLHTGRTIRAALNEIFSFGRPSRVLLAVLIDRGGRELPIQADVVGENLLLATDQHIKLCAPSFTTVTTSSPLTLKLHKTQ